MKFSIIIPTKDKFKNVQRLLLNLTLLNYDFRNIEIIVVNNAITDETWNVIENFSLRYPTFDINYIKLGPLGPSFARNEGVKKAKHNYLIFIDDDCVIPKHFLSNYKKAWQKHSDARIIGGKINVMVNDQIKLSKKQIEKIKDNNWCFANVDHGNEERISQDLLLTANLSVKKRREDSLNKMFNENLGINTGFVVLFGEDAEFLIRNLLKKEKIVYDPNILVFNNVDSERFSFNYLKKRYFLMGIETYRMEYILKKDFPKFSDTFRARFKSILKDILFGRGWSQLVDYSKNREKLYFVFSYFFCGSKFI